jgi:thiol-disulfide isomerase/thioredoxin
MIYKSLKLLVLSVLISNCGSSQEKDMFSQEALNEVFITSEGGKITFKEVLAKHLEKNVLVDVWASWCPDCINGMSKLKDLQSKFPDLQMVYLSYDKTPEAWQSAITKYDLNGDHYLMQSAWKGGDFRKHIDLDWIPRYILIDKKGKIVKYRAIEADDENLINILKTL